MLNINFWNIAFTIINLSVLYLFMKHFLIGPVSKIVEERKAAVEEDLDKAAQAKEEAKQIKMQYEASMKNAEEGASRLIADAKSRAAEAYESVMKQAEQDAQRRMEEAKKSIALEREKVMNDLQSGVAGLAMAAAAKLLKEQSGPEGDRNLYNRFLAESGDGNE